MDSITFVVAELPAMTIDLVSLVQPTCNGDSDGSLEVNAGGGTAPYTYSWNTNPIQNSALATGLVAGIYSATAIDANGCNIQLDTILNQPDLLIADAQVLGNIICFGDSTGVAFAQGIGGTAPYNYFWVETAETTQMISNLWAGTFNLTVTDDNGCQATSAADIIEYADVHAEIIFDPGFCPGDTVDFYVATNGLNNQYNFEWHVDQVLQGTTNVFSYPINDTVDVNILMVNTGNCPTVKDSAVVGPIMIPQGNIAAFGTPNTVCFGSNAMIHGVITDTAFVTSVFWNDTSLAGLGPHSVSPQMSTEYIVTIENLCGEQQSDTVMLNLFMPPNAAILASGTSGCDRVEANFDFSFDPYGYNFVGAYWSIFNQTYDEESPTVEFTYSADVPSTLHLSFDNGCTFKYDDIIGIEVFESPEANFYFNPDPAIQNEITEFVDISHGNPKEWEWYMDGQLIGDEERPSYVFEETGEYEVTEVIIDENGCSDTITHSVEVIGIYTVYVPNAFTPDGNGVNNTFRPIMTDVVPDNYEFLIFNRWGEVIFRAENLDAEWDGSFLGDPVQDGVYIWKVFVTDNVGLEHEIVGNVTLLR
jgi:gliding motility-associated-like protein